MWRDSYASMCNGCVYFDVCIHLCTLEEAYGGGLLCARNSMMCK